MPVGNRELSNANAVKAWSAHDDTSNIGNDTRNKRFSMISRKLFREPLLHFFILGALLFVLFSWLNRDSAYAPDEIVVSQGQLDVLSATFERTWQRPPTEEELAGLVDAWIKEEIFYREGVAIGFDRDDPIIRRRVAQKMSFVADGMVPDVPDDEELGRWLEAHSDDYRIPPSYSFRQAYFDPQRHGEQLESVLADARRKLDSDSNELPGDSTLLPIEMKDASATTVARMFGTEFADALGQLEVGTWQGPVGSGYGVHFVYIEASTAGRSPTLDEVRQAVERDVLNDKSSEINEAFYQSLRERYTIRREQETAE
jgi:hypothetical protein